VAPGKSEIGGRWEGLKLGTIACASDSRSGRPPTAPRFSLLHTSTFDSSPSGSAPVSLWFLHNLTLTSRQLGHLACYQTRNLRTFPAPPPLPHCRCGHCGPSLRSTSNYLLHRRTRQSPDRSGIGQKLEGTVRNLTNQCTTRQLFLPH
jgi:hypothetical protein